MSFLSFVYLIKGLGVLFGFSVTSWGRSWQHNHDVGGLDNSWHLDWMAVDGKLDQPQKKDEFTAACRLCGLEVVDEGDHLHVEPRGEHKVALGGW